MPHTKKNQFVCYNSITKEEEEDLEDCDYILIILRFIPQSRRLKPVKQEQYFFLDVLVIWSKILTPLMYCRYGINKSSNSVNPEKEETRKEILLKLQKIVSFCFQEPNSVALRLVQ
jgi:hypothetical protein